MGMLLNNSKKFFLKNKKDEQPDKIDRIYGSVCLNNYLIIFNKSLQK